MLASWISWAKRGSLAALAARSWRTTMPEVVAGWLARCGNLRRAGAVALGLLAGVGSASCSVVSPSAAPASHSPAPSAPHIGRTPAHGRTVSRRAARPAGRAAGVQAPRSHSPARSSASTRSQRAEPTDPAFIEPSDLQRQVDARPATRWARRRRAGFTEACSISTSRPTWWPTCARTAPHGHDQAEQPRARAVRQQALDDASIKGTPMWPSTSTPTAVLRRAADSPCSSRSPTGPMTRSSRHRCGSAGYVHQAFLADTPFRTS